MKLLVWTLAAAALALAGCSTGACNDNQQALPLAGFYSSSTDESVNVSGLQVQGENNDSLLLQSATTTSSVYLPFKPDADVTAFVFTMGQEEEIVTFHYSRRPKFVSAECGVSYVFTIKEVTHTGTLIDSVAVTDSIVTNEELERIKIYFTPTETDDEEEASAQ